MTGNISPLRADYAPADEALASGLLASAPRSATTEARIDARATHLIEAIRAKSGGLGGVEDFLHAYALSTKEGLALMVLAEALLRIPDPATADRLIEDKLKGGDIEAAFWLTIPREQRDQIQKLKSDKVPTELMERYGGFREGVHEYADAMASGEVHLEFDRVETTSRDRGTEYASVVFRVHSPKGDSHALILASSFHGPRGPSWSIRDHRFDYTPGSYEAPVVSGHGHSR